VVAGAVAAHVPVVALGQALAHRRLRQDPTQDKDPPRGQAGPPRGREVVVPPICQTGAVAGWGPTAGSWGAEADQRNCQQGGADRWSAVPDGPAARVALAVPAVPDGPALVAPVASVVPDGLAASVALVAQARDRDGLVARAALAASAGPAVLAVPAACLAMADSVI
jgi:hypothetical protein